jgi:hypothetical protein
MPDVSNTVSGWQQIIVASFQRAFDQILSLAPNVLAMLVVLVAGYFVARIAGKVIAVLSTRIGLETAAQRSGLAGSMKQVGITQNVSWILGQIVFWLLMCVFLTAAFNILGLQTLTAAMEQIVAYIPNLLAAAVVVVVGLLVATFLRGVIATGGDRVGLSYAEQLANGCYWILAAMTFIAAFKQLHIEVALLEQMILIAFGGLALGFGLAFGLGGRDVMAGILAGYYARQRFHAGDHIAVANMEGTVREVGPVATIIETQEEGLLSRHSVPNTKVLNEAVR